VAERNWGQFDDWAAAFRKRWNEKYPPPDERDIYDDDSPIAPPPDRTFAELAEYGERRRYGPRLPRDATQCANRHRHPEGRPSNQCKCRCTWCEPA